MKHVMLKEIVMQRTWQERFDDIKETAEKTVSFSYNPVVQKMYFRLLYAVKNKDAKTTKHLIKKMGF